MGPKTTGKTRERDEVAGIDQEVLFRNNDKNRWGRGDFDLNKPKSSSITEQNKNEFEPVRSTEESEEMKSSFIFPMLDAKDYDITESTIHFSQSQSCDWKTEIEEHRSRGKFEEGWVQLHDWPKNSDTQNFGWPKFFYN